MLKAIRHSFGIAIVIAMAGFCLPALSQDVWPESEVAPVIVAQAQYRQDAPQRGRGQQPVQERRVGLTERIPPPSQGFSLRRFFGLEETPAPAPAPVQAPVVRRPKPKAPVVHQERTKPGATNRVVVFGDWLGETLASGLDDVFADMPNIAVARRIKSDSGLMRGDADSWPKNVKDYLSSGQKVTVSAIMLGMADRVAKMENGEQIEPLSERWKEVYSARVDAVLAAFAEHGIPVVWIGLPPVENEEASEAHAIINGIIRERVLRAGGRYVDIWPGFVDTENHYVDSGAGTDGQPTRLRLNDGVRFTRKGADKIAHYAAVEIRRQLGAAASLTDVPTTLGDTKNSGAFVDIDRTVVPQGDMTTSISGPVMPLTRAETSPGGLLLTGKTGLDALETARRALREGAPTAPVSGRADDFTLPQR